MTVRLPVCRPSSGARVGAGLAPWRSAPIRWLHVEFGRIAPIVAVRDIRRAIDFYVGVLGMTVTFTNGDPVGFVVLERDRAELQLTLDQGEEASAHNVAHLLVDNAADLYDYLQRRQVRIVKGLRDTEYGLRGFVFTDPEGNRIDVGQIL